MLAYLFLLLHFASFPENVIVYLVYHPCRKGLYLVTPRFEKARSYSLRLRYLRRNWAGDEQGLITSTRVMFITLTLTISFFEHQIPLFVASQFGRGYGEDCPAVLISYHFRSNPLPPSLQHCLRLPDIQGRLNLQPHPRGNVMFLSIWELYASHRSRRQTKRICVGLGHF